MMKQKYCLESPRSLALAVFLVTCGIACTASRNEVTGTWDYTLQSPQGTAEGSFVFTHDGNQLSGSISSPRGIREEIKTGSVRGDEIEFTVERMTPGGDAALVTYKGKVSGNTMQGNFLGPGGHLVEWTATRSE